MTPNEAFISSLALSSENSKELLLWNDTKEVGFSILKEYPKNSDFVPIKNPASGNDSVILIKVGYFIEQIKDNKVALLLSVHKGSRYLFQHHFYNFDDPACPTKDSVIASEKSKQPSDLFEFQRFIYAVEEKSIFDTYQKKNISGNEMINYLCDLHLKTITDFPFRSKQQLKKWGYKLPAHLNPFLQKLLRGIGWELNIPRDDYLIGVLQPYSFRVHTVRKESDKIEFLGIPVPKISAIICSSLIFLLIFINFYFHKDVFYIVSFLKEIVSNQIFILAFLVFILYATDYVLPRIIIIAMNLSIYIRKLASKPTKIY